jgi:hypothetical protein
VTQPHLRHRLFSPKIISTIAFILLSFASHASSSPSGEPTPHPRKFNPTSDVSLGVEGDLSATGMPTTTNGYALSGTAFTQVTQRAAAAGAFASFHQSFTP